MHLLQAGVNHIYIRDILGHVSVKTTEVYARADLRVTMYFQISQWENEVECLELDKFEKVIWHPIDNIPEDVSPTVQHVLAQIKLGNSYSNIFLDEKYNFKKWKKKLKKRKLKRLAQEQVTDHVVADSDPAKETLSTSRERV